VNQYWKPHARILSTILVSIAVSILGSACDDAQPATTGYEQEILEIRLAKDAQFFDPEETILRPKELAKFTGLNYFKIDSTYRYVVRLERIANPPTVLISKQTSGPVPYQHIGNVRVPGPDTTIVLSVFWYDEMEDNTGWIPFTDATNNIDTYGGGRYLDVELGEDDEAVLDFNRASNPYCTYNAYDFNCAIPPASNRLTFRMPAGEKKPLLLDG